VTPSLESEKFRATLLAESHQVWGVVESSAAVVVETSTGNIHIVFSSYQTVWTLLCIIVVSPWKRVSASANQPGIVPFLTRFLNTTS
jgi:hypothetical protein